VHNTAPDGVTYCYAVTAIAGGQESVPTADACRAMPPLVPNPPTNLIVTVAVVQGMNMTPAYRVTRLGTRSGGPIGYVAVNEPCIGKVLFNYRGFAFRKVDSSKVNFWGTVPNASVAAPCQKQGYLCNQDVLFRPRLEDNSCRGRTPFCGGRG
jgi:hypothetical protein